MRYNQSVTAPSSSEHAEAAHPELATRQGATISFDNLPSVLTEPNLSYLLNVPIKRIRKWSYDGRGPKTFKVGNIRLVRRDEFLKWFAARER